MNDDDTKEAERRADDLRKHLLALGGARSLATEAVRLLAHDAADRTQIAIASELLNQASTLTGRAAAYWQGAA